VDQSTAVQSGGGPWDDINLLWLEPYDPVNGVELNLYALSYTAMGNLAGGGTVTYDLFPWVTCGCEADSNDFDADAASTGTAITVTSRSGVASWTPPASGATAWANNPLSGFATDSDALEYGVWHVAYDLTTTSSFPYNWATYEFGNWDAADPSGSGPPPSSQPEPSTARLYYTTTDGGGADPPVAPAKEYVEQMVRHTSGPNPPVAGQTSVFTATVRVVNPTAYPIEFSAANTVTAWVPGGDAVYNGNLQLAQGSVVSQPAVGGSGDVVWNPGTVAAGDTVIMAYEVAVTPSSSGQRVPVTGWPGNHGTTATYVDGTCAGAGCSGAQLTGATPTVGPLCGLAVTENQLTHAVVSAFRVLDDAGETVVEWETGSEEGALAFRLLRETETGERTPVLATTVPALWTAPRGGVYRVRDGRSAPGDGSVYWLEELEAGGRRILHGPYGPGTEPMPRGPEGEWPPAGRTWERRPHAVETTSPAAVKRAVVRAEKNGRLAIGVAGGGVVRVTASELARAAGVPETTIRRLLRAGFVRLENRGRPVAWSTDAKGFALLFHAEPIDSIYTTENVYVLSVGHRSGTIGLRNASAAAGTGTGSFEASIHAEEDRLPATVLGLDPDSDYWFWDYVVAGDPDLDHRVFPLDAPDPAPGEGTLRVRFQGASDTGDGFHEARIVLDGTELGTVSWRGFEPHEAAFPFDAALLRGDGSDTVVVEATGGSAGSLFFVDSFDLHYPRRFHLGGGQLAFSLDGEETVTLTGEAIAGARVFDVTDPLQPVELSGAFSGQGLTFRLAAGRYLAVSQEAFLEPSSIRPLGADDPLLGEAEYLVIAPESLGEPARILAAHRRRAGLRTKVVTVEQVMDFLNGSIFDPRVIRTFLERAWRQWSSPPRFVVLLGPGNLDYRRLLGPAPDGAPVLLLKTSEGLYGADGLFTDFDGDGVPEIPVGRLPFTDRSMLEEWLTRAATWESGGVLPSVLAVSDDREGAADFSGDAAYVTDVLPRGFSREWTGLDAAPVAEVRETLFEALGRGVTLVQYFGHGGSDRWADEGILTVDDLDGSHPFAGAPFVTALTCAVNRFEVPGYACLGERLLDPARGGAVAVWAPSGLTARGDLRELGRGLERALVLAGGTTLGEAVGEALASFRPAGDPAVARLLFNMLGDPALPVVFDCSPGGGGTGTPDSAGGAAPLSPPVPAHPGDGSGVGPVEPDR